MANLRWSRPLGTRIILTTGSSVLLGLITLASTRAGGISGPTSLTLAAIVALASALIFLMLDSPDARPETSRDPGYALPTASSTNDGALTKDFLQVSQWADGRINPLLQRLAQREIERLNSFARQLPAGSWIEYDGEDRDWLLGLTHEAKRSIDAISLHTVDAWGRGLDGGLWGSDLGARYLDAQRKAIDRKVRVRRIFVFNDADMASHEDVMNITERQRSVGVDVRKLDHPLIKDWMQPMIFDFIIFDKALGYETTPYTSVAMTNPSLLKTSLVPMPRRVRQLEEQFEQLWEAADPGRQLD